MRGILLVNKRQGWTSFDAVNFCKRVFNTREVGHLGTLDPMATGVLAVTVGSATKLFDMFLNKTKTYVASFTFGYSTDTLDAEGEIDMRDLIEDEERMQTIAYFSLLNYKIEAYRSKLSGRLRIIPLVTDSQEKYLTLSGVNHNQQLRLDV